MSLREQFQASHPDFPWLSPEDPAGVERLLDRLGWLQPDEAFIGCETAGDGDMNLTLRVKTSRRTMILKQARPWVERHDHIAAPWDRALHEQRFYTRVASLPPVHAMMADLYGSDPDARAVLIEDVPGAADLSNIYADQSARPEEMAELARWLRALHEGTQGPADAAFANREMRELNRQRIFEVPLREDNGLDLDPHEPGLRAAAERLRQDEKYMQLVAETAKRYMADGSCLVHGDFFPGSWLRTPAGVRVIDAEFCHWGDPEFDLGCAVGHLALARQRPMLAQGFLATYHHQPGSIHYNPEWVARYAAAEIMRRLIGLPQLPIPPSDGWRAELLARSRKAMLEKSLDPVWR